MPANSTNRAGPQRYRFFLGSGSRRHTSLLMGGCWRSTGDTGCMGRGQSAGDFSAVTGGRLDRDSSAMQLDKLLDQR